MPHTARSTRARRLDRKVALFAALDAQNLPVLPKSGMRAICPDCKQSVVGHAGPRRRHHFRHLPTATGERACPGVSAAHLHMQAVARSLLVDPIMEYQLGNRRGDVGGRNIRGLRFIFECQVSPIKLDSMEMRVRDWNGKGYAVIWVFKRELFRTNPDGTHTVPAWIIDWCRKRGWNQGYAIDERGRIEWFLLNSGTTKTADSTTMSVDFEEISSRRRSRLGERLTLTADTVSVNNRDPLVVGAYVWATEQELAHPTGATLFGSHVEPRFTSLRYRR